MIVADVYFDGELVASGATPGWSTSEPRTLDIGPGLVAHYGPASIDTNAEGLPVFVWTDNTNTRAGRAQDANVVTTKLLAEYVGGGDHQLVEGNYPTGPWSVVVVSIG